MQREEPRLERGWALGQLLQEKLVKVQGIWCIFLETQFRTQETHSDDACCNSIKSCAR